jgi:aldehyde dehydrogenase
MTDTAAPVAPGRSGTGLPQAPVRVAGAVLGAPMSPVCNPARTHQVVGEVANGEAGHVDAAVAAARRAFTGWAALTPAERAAALRAAAASLQGETERLAVLLTREQGKVLWESRLDVAGAAHILGYYAGLAPVLDDRVFRQDARGTVWLARRPMGVAGVIVPWNSPIYLAFLGIAPALMAGNPVVVKPSELAPLALSEVLRLLAEQLPPGVVNTVPGGAEAGAAIAGHPDVGKVFFTGSIATGRQVMRTAAGNLKRLSLELGGNDPALILRDATIDDRLVDELVRAVFTLSGQVCFNVKRIYVHEARYPEFVERYCRAVDALVVGDGLDPAVTMGPLNNRAQFERVSALLERSAAQGEVHTLGRKADPASWTDGYFLLPSVVTGLPPDAELVGCEQFGPVIPVLAFTDDDEAVRLANGTDFGLAASVWSDDRAHARQLASRLEAGSVFLNVHRIGASDVSMPFGGFKQSGLGRNHGEAALDSCTELQTIADYTDVSGFPGPETFGGPAGA